MTLISSEGHFYVGWVDNIYPVIFVAGKLLDIFV